MTIIRCPRCRDEVTAPAKASRLAVVRCPLCLEEYPLADALQQVPPELIVVGAAESEGAETEVAEGYAVSGGPAAGGLFDASAGAGAAAPARPAFKGTRPRRKQGSAIGSIVGIVLGGVAGISLAVLLLWWVFKTDVGVGPTVARYVPWIVPAQFHGKDKSGDASLTSPTTTENGAATQASANTARFPRPSANGKQKQAAPPADSSSKLQMLPDAGGPSPLVGGEGGLTIDDPLGGPKPASANVDLAALDPAAPLPLPENSDARPAVGGPATSPPDLTRLLPANTPPAPPLPPPTPAQPPTAEDFTQAVVDAGDALARYDNSAGDEAEAKKAKFTDMYLAVSDVGRVVSHLSIHDAEIEGMVKELKSLLEKLAGVGGPSKLSAVRFLAASHWPERKHGAGMLAAGVVKEFKAAGPHFEITLDAAARMAPLSLPVVSANNPQDFCQLEDELLLVGRVIDDPQTNLPGYEGQQPRVILLGYCIKVPKPQ